MLSKEKLLSKELNEQKQLLLQKDDPEKKYKKDAHRSIPFDTPSNADWIAPLVLTLLSFFTRLYDIGKSNFVVWDEAHFGKFASYYLKREFYFDVHPPLGKMLLGLSGVFARYNGSFAFESGTQYPADLNYTVMRVFCAIFGALMVPIAYFTAVQLKFSRLACILMSTLVLTDIAFMVISRFILLDSMLLFFTSLTCMCFCFFRNEQRTDPLGIDWWIWLISTGISLGCVLSVKWVGLFAITLVGLFTLEDLWGMLGDLKMPIKTYAKHWIARIFGLILVPTMIYMFSFWLHFTILNQSGPGDAQMSSLFQAGLENNDFYLNPIDIAYGSKVTFKNNGRGGGLLHSHIQTYPIGSLQQQVTCYHHKDTNNEWNILREWKNPTTGNDTFIGNGDIIRISHATTGRNLHSHKVEAPVTRADHEVSGYGSTTIGDTFDHWKVEIVDDISHSTIKNIKSLTTRFRLRHVEMNCYLKSHPVTLPQWGFKQAEVTCDKSLDTSNSQMWWNIEQHWNDALPTGGKNLYKRNFMRDFIDLNIAMWTSNNALTPDPEKESDGLTSGPAEWPLLMTGLRMCGWGDDAIKYYLLGNPMTWVLSFASIVLVCVLFVMYACRQRRQIKDFTPNEEETLKFAAQVGFGGWFLHYFPFWIMGRVTYLHHYFPALYFAIITLTLLIDFYAKKLGSRMHSVVLISIMVLNIGIFLYFVPFALGFTGPSTAYGGRKWYHNWKIHDTPDDPVYDAELDE